MDKSTQTSRHTNITNSLLCPSSHHHVHPVGYSLVTFSSRDAQCLQDLFPGGNSSSCTEPIHHTEGDLFPSPHPVTQYWAQNITKPHLLFYCEINYYKTLLKVLCLDLSTLKDCV